MAPRGPTYTCGPSGVVGLEVGVSLAPPAQWLVSPTPPPDLPSPDLLCLVPPKAPLPSWELASRECRVSPVLFSFERWTFDVLFKTLASSHSVC